jgi:hypothetical protein
MMRLIDISGQKFGRWAVLALHPERRRGQAHWRCRCDCGTERIVRGNNLRFGSSTSCGCIRRERTTKHGLCDTRAYNTWKNMKQRCFNPRHPKYPDYGERGISICQHWCDFQDFYADVLDPPPGKSIDRIDNDGNYEPGNCRWATPTEQTFNRRPFKRKGPRHE